MLALLPEEVLYDACDVLSSIIMTRNPSDLIPESPVMETCQLHERAIQEGSFDDRRCTYRFFHNFFACFPDHAARVIPVLKQLFDNVGPVRGILGGDLLCVAE
jgi:hypothetical protein